MENINSGNCAICGECVTEEDSCEVHKKGADTINSVSDKLGNSVRVQVGEKVHVKCRKSYTKLRDVEKCLKEGNNTQTKRSSSRLTHGDFHRKTDCLYCECSVCLNPPSKRDGYCVKTDAFVKKVTENCQKRWDEWAFSVKSRIDCFNDDLFSADCCYHEICDTNFRTGRSIPTKFMPYNQENSISDDGPPRKRKTGRPEAEDQARAFEKLCQKINSEFDRQWTISEIIAEMEIQLENKESEAYVPKYAKQKLLEYFGNSIVVSQKEGSGDIFMLRESTNRILRDFYTKSKLESSEEAKKYAILEAAARFLKSDTISEISTDKSYYPTSSQLNTDECLQYLPRSLRYVLEELASGKDTRGKVASLGHALIQLIRPVAVIAPLQVGLGIQLHHHFRSRYLIDTLNALGFCASYDEILRFNLNAASCTAYLPIGNIVNGMSVLFAADNVDHNSITVDGKGTFHGMGMIAVVNGKQHPDYHTSKIPRHESIQVKLIEKAKIDIGNYRAEVNAVKPKFTTLKQIIPQVLTNTVDIMWRLSSTFQRSVPNWGGTMHLISKLMPRPTKSEVFFLNMIDMNPSDRTCIYSTLSYLSGLAAKYGIPAVVTFDQPLFWKAAEIINNSDDSLIKNIVLMLGSFHMLMNLLGSIGTLMDGSGLRSVLQRVYEENTVQHMMHGKAVERALRGFLLVDLSLSAQIAGKCAEDDPEFNNLLTMLENMYDSAVVGNAQVDCHDPVLLSVMEKFAVKINEFKDQSKTNELWIGFQEMIQVVRDLVRGDRTADIKTHLSAVYNCLPIFAAAGHYNYVKSAYLYLMKMHSLKDTHPDVYGQFQQGHFVARRSGKYWSGIGMDLAIESTLMRSLKTTGGLTRGSHMPVTSHYAFTMQEFSGKTYESSDQHKETSESRIKRDNEDLQKITSYLMTYPVFTPEKSLRNIVTGTEADPDVNVPSFRELGSVVVNQLSGNEVFSYSFKRKDKAITFTTSHGVKIDDERQIDPAALFQRLYVVSKSCDISLKEAMLYELCPFPPSLFEKKDAIRPPDKPALAQAILKEAGHSTSEMIVPDTERYVIDRGSLLYRVKWQSETTYAQIIQAYLNMIRKFGYEKTTVVFDGYSEALNTKQCTQNRRHPVKSTIVHFSGQTKFQGKRDDFLSNPVNKDRFLKLLGVELFKHGVNVIHATGDADLEIVLAAVSLATRFTTSLIGEDTDLLVLLLYHTNDTSKQIFFRSDKASNVKKIYDITSLRTKLGNEKCRRLLFCHAISGCDTTSRIFGVGKHTVVQKLKNSAQFKKSADELTKPYAQKDHIISHGISAIIALFNGTTESLTDLRYKVLQTKVLSTMNFVTPERLPPTYNSAVFHILRTYFQIMIWMNTAEHMDPTEWGWKMMNEKLVPIMTDLCPAPKNLLAVVHCNCKTACSSMRCSCRKYGLVCTDACGLCQTASSCENTPVPEEELSE